MNSVPRKIAADWMAAPPTRAVMDALAAGGGESRFVGGCVRNTLIGRPVNDIDIATTLTPQAVMDALRAAGLKAVPTGVEHGTVTAVAAGKPFEITTLRRDVATDGRHAEVAFTDDWAADAARRDFTMNALYADTDGRLSAPVGGVEDALAGRVRFVGDPASRIVEDYLRILRFFRFHAWYGQGAPDAAGLAACAAHVDGMARLAAERIGKEVMTLLAAPDPSVAIAAMCASGVMREALGVAGDAAVAARCVGVEAALGYNPGPLRRLAAIAGGKVTDLRERLRLSNNQAVHLAALAALIPAIDADLTADAARVFIYRNGRAVWRDAAVTAWALAGAAPEDADWRRLAALAQWDPPAFPLRGRDLEGLGVAPGPRIGSLLKDLERRWIASDFALDRAALLALAAQEIA